MESIRSKILAAAVALAIIPALIVCTPERADSGRPSLDAAPGAEVCMPSYWAALAGALREAPPEPERRDADLTPCQKAEAEEVARPVAPIAAQYTPIFKSAPPARPASAPSEAPTAIEQPSSAPPSSRDLATVSEGALPEAGADADGIDNEATTLTASAGAGDNPPDSGGDGSRAPFDFSDEGWNGDMFE